MGKRLMDYLKTHPRTRDLSAAKFGEHIGIGKSSAAEILAGRSNPEERTLKKIADAFAMPLAHLEELVLLDIPFELQEGAQLLNLKERAFIRTAVNQLLESSGKADRVQPAETVQREAPNNVVELPRPKHAERVKKAAYAPPPEE